MTRNLPSIQNAKPLAKLELPSPTTLVDADEKQLPALRRQIEAALEPADATRTKKAALMLVGSFKTAPGVIGDEKIFIRGLTEELGRYPEDVQDEAIRLARRKFSWLPSIAEMVALCESLVTERREALDYLKIRQRGIRDGSDHFLAIKYMARAKREGTAEEKAAAGRQLIRDIRRHNGEDDA